MQRSRHPIVCIAFLSPRADGDAVAFCESVLDFAVFGGVVRGVDEFGPCSSWLRPSTLGVRPSCAAQSGLGGTDGMRRSRKPESEPEPEPVMNEKRTVRIPVP